MRKSRWPMAALGATLLALVLSSAAAEAAMSGPLRVGVAKVDITPRNLQGLNAFGGGGSFAGVHDPIYARALVMGNGAEVAAIVSLDLVEVGDMTPLRERIQRELGIPADHLIICATHDHLAPPIGSLTPGTLAHARTPQDNAYTQYAYGRIITALREAKGSMQLARFGVGRGSAYVNINRNQFTLARGWIMGINPRGPSDETVWVLKFDTLSGAPIAILFNYGVHSTVTIGSGLVSGDLAGAAERYVERHYGGKVVALDTLGPMGDQNPKFMAADLYPSRYGSRLPFSGATAAQMEDFRRLAYAALQAQSFMLGAEVVRVSDRIHASVSQVHVAADQSVFWCPVKRGVHQLPDMHQARVATIPIRLSLILLNQVAFGGVAGEVVTPIYQHLMRETPLTDTIMVSIANSRVGYIANDSAYDTHNFDVNGSPAALGCAEDGIVNGLVGMIDRNLY